MDANSDGQITITRQEAGRLAEILQGLGNVTGMLGENGLSDVQVSLIFGGTDRNGAEGFVRQLRRDLMQQLSA